MSRDKNSGDQSDGESEDGQDLSRLPDWEQSARTSASGTESDEPRTEKLIEVSGSGLSGPFIRRPVMTVLLTLSVIVAGIATYGKLAVNAMPAVEYSKNHESCG